MINLKKDIIRLLICIIFFVINFFLPINSYGSITIGSITEKQQNLQHYYFLGNYYRKNKDIKKAIFYYNDSYILAKKFKNKQFELLSLESLFWIYFNEKKINKEFYYCKAIIKNSSNNKPQLADRFYYMQTGFIYKNYFHNYSKSIFYYKKAVLLYKSVHNFYETGRIYLFLGFDYLDLKDFYYARKYALKSIHINSRQNSHSLFTGFGFELLGLIYLYNSNKYFSILYYKKAYKIFKKDKFYSGMKGIKSLLVKLNK